MAYVKTDGGRTSSPIDWDRIVYRLVFSAVFAPSLVLAACGRALRAGAPRVSVFAEARASAHTAAGFAFQR